MRKNIFLMFDLKKDFLMFDLKKDWGIWQNYYDGLDKYLKSCTLLNLV